MIDADGHGGEPADWQERLPREFQPHMAARREGAKRQFANLPGVGEATRASGAVHPVRRALTETASVCHRTTCVYKLQFNPMTGFAAKCFALPFTGMIGHQHATCCLAFGREVVPLPNRPAGAVNDSGTGFWNSV